MQPMESANGSTLEQCIVIIAISCIAIIAYINVRFDELLTNNNEFVQLNTILLHINELKAKGISLPKTMPMSGNANDTKARIFCSDDNVVIVNYNNRFLCGRDFKTLNYDNIRLENNEWITHNRGNPWTIVPFIAAKFGKKYAL